MKICLREINTGEKYVSTHFEYNQEGIAFYLHDFGEYMEHESWYKLDADDSKKFLALIDCQDKNAEEIKAVLLNKFGNGISLIMSITDFFRENNIICTHTSWVNN